jgi:competence protein ComGC
MNRIQFFVLTGLSSLVVLLLIGHILLVRQTNFEQNRLAAAQQVINQGQAFQGNLKQLAVRIYQDSQKTQDPGLKDLLDRQQIKYTPSPEGAAAPDASVPPASSAPTH